ncbi:MAG: nucleotide-binding protein [Niveispirillum sp.]|uniref:nucleotide-binding protein n=1 Tax=Niveispirillum sp. TaxID=1917217 RepID=UPI004035DF11
MFNFPLCMMVLSGKGGVGKTLLSLLLADLFDLNGIPLDIVQVDDQRRLELSLGRDVTSIDIALLRKARKNPNILTTAFAPLYRQIEAMPISGRSLLIDIGATQQHLLLDYAELTELNEDFIEFSISLQVFIPVVTDPESIDQAIRQIKLVERVLPSAKLCVVLNERDGRFSELARGSVAGNIFHRQLQPLQTSIPFITMPRIDAGSWAHFERQHCRLIDVVGYDIPTAMAASGLSRPEAKLARGDVAAWFQVMENAMASLLLLAGDSHHG